MGGPLLLLERQPMPIHVVGTSWRCCRNSSRWPSMSSRPPLVQPSRL